VDQLRTELGHDADPMLVSEAVTVERGTVTRTLAPRGLLLACLCVALLGLAFTGCASLVDLFARATDEVKRCGHGDPCMDDVP
jgi:hypothetical protein